MSKKRYIDTSFWHDTWVSELTTTEKFFFLYLITNDRTNIAGVYELPLKHLAFGADLSVDEVKAMFESMKDKVAYIDGWVVLRNGIKNQNYNNDKIRRGIVRILEEIPQKLVPYITVPYDFEYKPQKRPEQQRLLDDSSMSHEGSSHLIESNLIKSNAEAKSQKGFKKKEMTKSQKRDYALAVKRDEALKKKEQGIGERKTTGIESARATIERIKAKK